MVGPAFLYLLESACFPGNALGPYSTVGESSSINLFLGKTQNPVKKNA